MAAKRSTKRSKPVDMVDVADNVVEMVDNVVEPVDNAINSDEVNDDNGVGEIGSGNSDVGTDSNLSHKRRRPRVYTKSQGGVVFVTNAGDYPNRTNTPCDRIYIDVNADTACKLADKGLSTGPKIARSLSRYIGTVKPDDAHEHFIDLAPLFTTALESMLEDLPDATIHRTPNKKQKLRSVLSSLVTLYENMDDGGVRLEDIRVRLAFLDHNSVEDYMEEFGSLA